MTGPASDDPDAEQRQSAEIIAFPVRRLSLPAPAASDEGQERLRRALAALDAAIAGQRTAVAAWRGALSDLRTVMAGLGDSMQRYRSSLDTLGTRVAALNGQAVELERTADAAIAVSRD